MGPLLSIFKDIPLVAAFIVLLLLMPVVWMFAPLLGFGRVYPFSDPWVRAILIGVVVLIFVVVALLRIRGRKKRDAGLVQAATTSDDAKSEAAAEEEAALREKLTTALQHLRTAKGGKGGFLYELPWYVIIGPPGSGKTTAIMQSGLEFPLAEGARLSGVGGTRNCDWWLTDQAVLLDTAGRYTTQDSDASADKAGWDRFVEMLRKNRPKQPLNGIIVCFGVDMISRLAPSEREQHARTVRRRIKELETQLGQRLPIYLLISKADLLAGFMEFYDDLDKDARSQVWGFTFPVEIGAEGATGKFASEYALLIQRLQDRLLERLQQERGPAQRAALAAFPSQFASLEDAVGSFVQVAFGGTRLDPAPFLRGVYFTSGTQEGTPIDRLTGALSRTFGLDPRRHASVMGQKGRSYFLGRLLREVVFNEARLAARDRRLDKRKRLVGFAVWILALLVIVGGAAWGYSIYSTEQQRAAALEAQLNRAEGANRGLPFNPVTDGDLARVLPYLDQARPLPAVAHVDSGIGLGLSQEEELVTGSELAYRRTLNNVFLPRLLSRLELQIRGNMQRADYLYEATRVYLMLGRQGPIDANLVKEWMLADWGRTWPGVVGQPTRDALLAHLNALLGQDFTRYDLDGALVDGARRVFSRLPMAERVYTRLRPLVQNIPDWKPADALGAAGQRFFVRASGKPLTDGIPGLFTVDGLYRGLLPQLGQAVREAASESWVLGPTAVAAGAEDPQRLEAAVLQTYAQEYARVWQTMLDDLNLPGFRTLPDAAAGLNILGSPNSPLKDLLRSITRQLSVGTPPEGFQAAGNTPAAGRVAAAQGNAPAPTGAEPVAQVVEAQFRAIREASGQPLDGVVRIIGDLYARVQVVVSAPPGTVPPNVVGLDPGQQLLAEAARQPDPLAKWIRSLAQTTGQARAGGAKAAIAAAGAQALGPLCRNIETLFPFRRDAQRDIPVDDFGKLFGPGGTMDQFFTQNVRAYVDTTQRPWRPMATEGLTPPVTAADVMQFQRAQMIRDAFFPGGAMMGGLRFELVPQGFDPGANGAILEVEGVRTEIGRAGPFRPLPMSWPSRTNLTLTFDPPSSAGPIAFDGGWSALKLVMGRQATMQTTPAPDRLRVTITQGDRSGTFELRAGSSQHPFGMRELADFRCPTLAP